MRTFRLATLLAVVAAASACSDPVGQQTPPEGPRLATGLYMGSGTFNASADSVEATSEPTEGSRASGYLGNGY